jgi:hypothetical protein
MEGYKVNVISLSLCSVVKSFNENGTDLKMCMLIFTHYLETKLAVKILVALYCKHAFKYVIYVNSGLFLQWKGHENLPMKFIKGKFC